MKPEITIPVTPTPRSVLIAMVAIALFAASAFAANPDDELWVTVAGHGPGAEESFWVTDLYIMNPDDEESVEIVITFLPQGADNSDAEGMTFEIEAGATLVLEDVVETLVGDQAIFGALHIEVSDEEEDAKWYFVDAPSIHNAEDIDDFLEDDLPLMVLVRVYDLQETGTKGQSLDGIPSHAAISANGNATTHVLGVTQNANFRSNWFGLNISTDEDENPVEAEVFVEVLDTDGNVVASESFTLMPYAPIFGSLSDLVTSLDNGTLRFTMEKGSGIFGGSKADNRTNDPTSLSSFWNLPDLTDLQYTDEFGIEECTFMSTGDNKFFPLAPGLESTLVGDEDGVEIEVVIEILEETKMVDGVETRVLVENESEDGELVEISRNYFAQCMETGDVYYFGEDVDDYEDGVIVGHGGEWLAGTDGARAGIFMPGTAVAGARYFQEIAPGVALDRAEHLATGVDVETEVGDFEGCLVVRDSSALTPGEPGDIKVYCPGVGLVIDEDIEIVEHEPGD